MKDGKAQCSCKDVRECPQVPSPVCGQNNETYINQCYLDVENCLMNENVDAKRPGKCGWYIFVILSVSNLKKPKDVTYYNTKPRSPRH